jgi:hypothetical protein
VTGDPTPPRSDLIEALERKRARASAGDVVDFALLRRTLARLPENPDPRALALVAGYCGPTYAAQDAGLLVACLWATRHRNAVPVDSTWNLGRALRCVPREQSERIWRGLCTANQASLPRRMSGAVEVLAVHGVAADWHRLHRDLRSWHQGFPHPVLRRWCTGLFGPLPGRTLRDDPSSGGSASDRSTARAAATPIPTTCEVSP